MQKRLLPGRDDEPVTSALPSTWFPLRRLPWLGKVVFGIAQFVTGIVIIPIFWSQFVLAIKGASTAEDRNGASITALFVLQIRYLMHSTGTRKDDGAAKLHLLGPFQKHTWFIEPVFVAQQNLCMAMACVASWRIPLRADPNTLYASPYEHFQGRFMFIDKALEYFQPVDQLVVMGAGYDTRAVNDNCGQANVVYEVDRPETQIKKLALLEKAGLFSSKAKYVSCNFNDESPWSKLEAAGFDCHRPFIIQWEGVCYYLEEHTCIEFLKKAASVMKGNAKSALVFDYFLLEHREALLMSAAQVLKSTGEAWLTFLPLNLQAYLEKNNIPLRVVDHVQLNRAAVALLTALE